MASKIKITDNFYFTADSDQYILMECGEREKIDRKTRKPTGEILVKLGSMKILSDTIHL